MDGSLYPAQEGIDGGQTATLAPEELDAEFFMMRVRSDGGRLTTDQLRAIGSISTDFGRDTADISDRQNIQLHWIRIEDVPAIWERLEAVGLDSMEACGDAPRVILGSPVAGIAADELIDGTPALEEIKRRFIGSPEFSNLPRKFKAAISGSSGCATRSSEWVLTFGSAAGCRRTPSSRSGWVPSSPWIRCRRSGRG